VYIDDTPVFDLLFELEVGLCERFTAFTPISLRKEKAREVFLLITRNINYSNKNSKQKKKVYRKPAGDDWF
jgi:hypothetical protein